MEELNEMIPYKKNKTVKRIILITILFVMFVLSLLLGTYAFWIMTRTQESTNVISTMKCLAITLEDETAAIDLDEAYPLIHEDGMNTNPYTFKLTNNCGNNIRADISLEVLNTTTLSDEYVRISIDPTHNLLSSKTKGTATITGATSYILQEEFYLHLMNQKNII